MICLKNKQINKKDYSEIIGKRYGELTILSYTEPLKRMHFKRMCTCRCSCGKEVTVYLQHVLREQTKSCGHLQKESARKHSVNLNQEKAYKARTSHNKPIVTNKTTGIRNISWSKKEQKFIVSLKRHGKYFKGRAETLDEAVQLKEQKVAEAEEFFQEKIYKS